MARLFWFNCSGRCWVGMAQLFLFSCSGTAGLGHGESIKSIESKYQRRTAMISREKGMRMGRDAKIAWHGSVVFWRCVQKLSAFCHMFYGDRGRVKDEELLQVQVNVLLEKNG